MTESRPTEQTNALLAAVVASSMDAVFSTCSIAPEFVSGANLLKACAHLRAMTRTQRPVLALSGHIEASSRCTLHDDPFQSLSSYNATIRSNARPDAMATVGLPHWTSRHLAFPDLG